MVREVCRLKVVVMVCRQFHNGLFKVHSFGSCRARGEAIMSHTFLICSVNDLLEF